VTREGIPIQDYHLSDGIDPGIEYSVTYSLWDSAIAAGATLEELQKMHAGRYSPKFLASLVAWNNMKNMIANHIEDAKAKKIKK
jgi:hypothetical protein